MAAIAVQLAFGFVHGVTLGFGMTMLGITVDYPVLLIGHRKQGEAAIGTLRRIGQAFTLAVVTATLGLTGMLFSGFPGLSQLGLFAVTGILVAAATTRWLLPKLIVAADLAPVSAGDAARLLRIEGLRRARALGAACCAIAALYLALIGGPRWERDLAALSPVPKSALDLDAELRSEIGAPDAGIAGLVRGETAESVLQQEESMLPALDTLQRDGAIGGAEIAARFLPSAATQLARRAALPAADELARRVAEALEGLPFRSDAFRPFTDAVAASRTISPVLPADLTSPVMAARLNALLLHRDDRWYGLIVPSAVHDEARVRSALQAAGATWLDIGAETNGIVADYTRSAWLWLACGALAALAALFVGLRDPVRVLRVTGAIAGAVLVTVALLTAMKVKLSLINIVSMQLVAGVGLDYALFFARRQLDEEERARTLRTLATCNGMAVLTFGLLALCRTPLLRQIGLTVVIGVLAAMGFAFLFAGQKPRSGPEPA
ncbi:MAG: MMPL family transporter [Acetobacteraceae bacterium]|nr:MMPL family transporter [Acetobacteraceae bacterium]